MYIRNHARARTHTHARAHTITHTHTHRALKKSHESEKRLIKKCRELNQEIVANAAKVQTALKLSQEDQVGLLCVRACARACCACV